MNVKSHDEIIDAVAIETGYSKEQIKFVISNFWKTMRYYITNPHKAKFGIIIEKFIKLYLPKHRLIDYVYYNHDKGPHRKRFDEVVNLLRIKNEYERKWKKKKK